MRFAKFLFACFKSWRNLSESRYSHKRKLKKIEKKEKKKEIVRNEIENINKRNVGKLSESFYIISADETLNYHQISSRGGTMT